MNVQLVSFLKLPYHIQMETRNWRNQSNVAEYFKISHISKDMHIEWLESLKENKPKNVAFMIVADGQNVGVTYFHSIKYDAGEADWGIYICRDNLRGKGMGTEVLKKSLVYAREVLKLKVVFLDVLKNNFIAVSLYEKLGFSAIGDVNEGDFLRYRKFL